MADFYRLSSQNLGLLATQVESFFKHTFNNGRVDGVDWGEPGRADLNIASSKIIEMPRSQLGPTGIMNADTQTNRRLDLVAMVRFVSDCRGRSSSSVEDDKKR
ncbi:hypothetical protein F1880_005665 [Penicillium rolfsii]|nr:hypothetical protein F1880_005665 [Penicillium rolfsii]